MGIVNSQAIRLNSFTNFALCLEKIFIMLPYRFKDAGIHLCIPFLCISSKGTCKMDDLSWCFIALKGRQSSGLLPKFSTSCWHAKQPQLWRPPPLLSSPFCKALVSGK